MMTNVLVQYQHSVTVDITHSALLKYLLILKMR